MKGRIGAAGAVELDGGGRIAFSQRAAAEAGRAVTVGVRPEHLAVNGGEGGGIAGRIEMIEQLGADTLTHIAYAGGIVILRTPHESRHAIGDELTIRADPARVYLFDAGTGARLR
jgi:sn-glycerol 3-phosphate transport system ATP-binding protein